VETKVLNSTHDKKNKVLNSTHSIHVRSCLEVIDTPSILSVIRKRYSLGEGTTDFVFRVDENAVRRKWNSPLVSICLL
jgi:hypothetical protein